MMLLSLETQKARFFRAFDALEQAFPYAKKPCQFEVFEKAKDLAGEPGGIEYLYTWAPSFEQAGVFIGGPWENAEGLNPALVKGTLLMDSVESIVELLSELRLLAIAEKKYKHPKITPSAAHEFLEQALALNMDLLFPPQDEAGRIHYDEAIVRAEKLFRFISRRISLQKAADFLAQEIEKLAVQRPIMTTQIESLIKYANQVTDNNVKKETLDLLTIYIKAVHGPTPISGRNKHNYLEAILSLDQAALNREGSELARAMKRTGLVSPFHVTFLHYAVEHSLELTGKVLGLEGEEMETLNNHFSFIKRLIRRFISADTRQGIYGLSQMIKKGVFSIQLNRQLTAMVKLLEREEVIKSIAPSIGQGNEKFASRYFMAHLICLLGQPLGVGQGFNPTCQSTRALSLWAQKDPAYLLRLLHERLTAGGISYTFETEHIRSIDLPRKELDYSIPLDSVSVLLLPHLHAVYNKMIELASGREGDIHRWVNPAFYGRWVNKGFCCLYDKNVDPFAFRMLFNMYYHPAYHYELNLNLPQPAGIFALNQKGELLGFHAISIQRTGISPRGEYRVYFFNPNNDSYQDWGQGIHTSIDGNGEKEGESSLPFDQFVSRLYAFHYP
ncbi:MAG TPA: hypothetical protein VEY51_16595 [Chondromyces sp.]|nr:hypothetical protein [Chondromyces sp.]